MRPLVSLSLLSLVFFGLVGCGGDGSSNRTDTGATEDRRPLSDLLLVLDESSSMQEEGGDLVVHLDILLQAFEDPDARAGVITVDVRGRAGALVDDWVALSSPDALSELQRTIACGAVCWNPAEVPSDPSHEPGDPLGAEVTREWLDATCGTAAWEDSCGGGDEEGLEAILEALCRASSDAPESCLESGSNLMEQDLGSSAGMPREGARVLALIVSDEGDGSRRLSQGEGDPVVYQSLYGELDFELFVTAIGPDYDPETGSLVCNSGSASSWGVERYHALADASGLRYHAIAEEDPSGDCVQRMSAALEDLAADLRGDLGESGVGIDTSTDTSTSTSTDTEPCGGEAPVATALTVANGGLQDFEGMRCPGSSSF